MATALRGYACPRKAVGMAPKITLFQSETIKQAVLFGFLAERVQLEAAKLHLESFRL